MLKGVYSTKDRCPIRRHSFKIIDFPEKVLFGKLVRIDLHPALDYLPT